MKKLALTFVVLLVLVTLPYWLSDQYYLHIVITTGLFIVGAMSLNLLLGYTGQLNLGHIAFFGIGAYVSALTSLGFEIAAPFGDGTIVVEPSSPFLGFVLATIIAGLFGFIIGKLSFKIRGAYFVIVTISFAEVTRLVSLNWVDLTQGPLALNNIPPMAYNLPFLGEGELWSKTPNYYLVLALAIVCYIIIRRIVQSRVGRAMIALRENEPLAVSAGINVTRYLNFAATTSAAMAGAAGALYAHYIRIIDPDVFLFIYTVTMVIMVITGGKGTLIGPIIGGIIFGILPVGLREVAGPEVQWIVYGVAMVLIVMFLPQGIVPAIQKWWTRRTGSET
ncbi:branched-chain amino acid ABC transporter permease [Pusillimonas sp. DMV24BSW_D]|uniref:branched-chain amino acid ABC transporter permease n=1 Tax=Neopusillimonas aestuarii TaxID=2716226 RepID=UPI001407B227|nr:branched-chain amino acid ABC transporter permease [Pusillimonas sp. DMV24BSW_D]QIM48091.1 branched-chain amino acid ABC transporter permease [Pusillimonas sp. DMV24BSW_D]